LAIAQGLEPVGASRGSHLHLYASELPLLLILFPYFDLYMYHNEVRNQTVSDERLLTVNDNFKRLPYNETVNVRLTYGHG
jgi:hypothetical protein